MNTPEALTPPHLHEAVKVSHLPRRDAGSPLSASLSVCEVEAKDRRSAGAAELVPAVEPVSDKILYSVFGEKLLEFAIKLSCQSLIV